MSSTYFKFGDYGGLVVPTNVMPKGIQLPPRLAHMTTVVLPDTISCLRYALESRLQPEESVLGVGNLQS